MIVFELRFIRTFLCESNPTPFSVEDCYPVLVEIGEGAPEEVVVTRKHKEAKQPIEVGKTPLDEKWTQTNNKAKAMWGKRLGVELK
jgi:hypothetical protein